MAEVLTRSNSFASSNSGGGCSIALLRDFQYALMREQVRRSAVNLNNTAISFIARGCFEHGTAFLKEAVGLMRTCLQAANRPDLRVFDPDAFSKRLDTTERLAVQAVEGLGLWTTQQEEEKVKGDDSDKDSDIDDIKQHTPLAGVKILSSAGGCPAISDRSKFFLVRIDETTSQRPTSGGNIMNERDLLDRQYAFLLYNFGMSKVCEALFTANNTLGGYVLPKTKLSALHLLQEAHALLKKLELQENAVVDCMAMRVRLLALELIPSLLASLPGRQHQTAEAAHELRVSQERFILFCSNYGWSIRSSNGNNNNNDEAVQGAASPA